MIARRLIIASYSVASLALAGVGVVHADQAHQHGVFPAGEVGDANANPRVIEIELGEGEGTMAYRPARIDVKLGETVRFVLKNKGALDHEFVLGTKKANREHAEMMASMPGMVHLDKNMTQVTSGQASDLTWKFTKKGEFEFACLIPGHYEAGMHGTLVVK